MLNKRFKVVSILILVSSFATVAVAQTPVPPRPNNNTNAIATLWPMSFNAQATNAAQSTRIAALEATVSALSNVPSPMPTVAAATMTPSALPTMSPQYTVTPQPSATSTAIPEPTSTEPAPTATAIEALPTATNVPPSEANCLNCVDPAKLAAPPLVIPDLHGQACPAWVHDLYLTPGPNGKIYRTFHLPVQPEGKPGAGCNFDHNHGNRDVTLSRANNLLPPYGYEADVAGMAEPHNGFKTEFANRGECNVDEGFCATSDTRVTVHMGTAGKGRLDVSMHTFAYDLVGDKGTVVHVRGMGDTGNAATQCDKEPDTSVRGFRLVAMPRDQALPCGITAPYEVWEFHLRFGDTTVASKFATFDGMTVGRKLADGSLALEPTGNTWPNGPFNGCKTDVYFGGGYYAHEVDETNAFGPQVVIFGSDNGKVKLDTVGKNTYKRPAHGCTGWPYTSN